MASSPSPSISISTVSDVYHVLLDRGMSEQELAQQSGISRKDIENLDARIPISKLNKIWDIAKDYTQQAEIGLYVGEEIDPARFSVVAQASFQCETLRDVLQVYARFFSIVNEAACLTLKEGDEWATLEFKSLSPDCYCISEMERMVVTALARCDYLTGRRIKVQCFNFQHAQPEYIAKYQEVCKGELKFSQEQTGVVFKKSALDLKVKHGNPYLLSVLTSYAEKLLRKVASSSDIKDKVRRFIRRHLAEDAELDVERAAKALNMSRHTLYRKLKKEQVSFQSLVEEVRQREAERYLKENKVSISEVAFLLGFSELSAFSRAFKRWTGESPAKFRAKSFNGVRLD
jgi:AraC-like DNA-binding protein